MLNYIALDKIFKSLGHPWRRHMIEWLCDREESASRLAEHLPLSLSAILKHLKALEKNGLIHTQKVGRDRICRIEPRALELLHHWVAQRRKVWDRRSG